MNEIEKVYLDDLQKIKETIRDAKNQTLVVVNSAVILTYYKIGSIINQRKTWGSNYVRKLANGLEEYGKGYSFDSLMKMSQFALIFTQNEILEQPVTKIAWGTLIKIFTKCSSKEVLI